MAKPKLPPLLRERVKNLFEQEFTNPEVLHLVREESLDYVKDQAALLRCMISLKGKAGGNGTAPKPPKPKPFDPDPYQDIIRELREGMAPKKVEKKRSFEKGGKSYPIYQALP